jgi:hypothetical protein
LQTVVVDPAWHVVEGVAQEMHVASLVGGLGQNLAQRGAQPGVVVGEPDGSPRHPKGL